MFVKAKAVHSIVGNYCAWHELCDTAEYVFGDYLYVDDNAYE